MGLMLNVSDNLRRRHLVTRVGDTIIGQYRRKTVPTALCNSSNFQSIQLVSFDQLGQATECPQVVHMGTGLRSQHVFDFTIGEAIRRLLVYNRKTVDSLLRVSIP